MQPHDFPAAEEGEGLQSFTETPEGFQRLAGIGNLAVDGFVIHAAQLLGPLLEELAGTLFDGVVVIAVNEEDGCGGIGWPGHAGYSISLPPFSLISSSHLDMSSA